MIKKEGNLIAETHEDENALWDLQPKWCKCCPGCYRVICDPERENKKCDGALGHSDGYYEADYE